MDLNLTGYFWGMPIDLTGKLTQDLKITDWLPLIVVFLAAGFTYFITVTMEKRKHKWELKRQVYFELIDVITWTRKVYEDNQINPVSEDPTEDIERKDNEIKIAHAFVAAKMKVYICGSDELNSFIDAQLPTALRSNNEIYKELLKKLKTIMKKELVESW